MLLMQGTHLSTRSFKWQAVRHIEAQEVQEDLVLTKIFLQLLLSHTFAYEIKREIKIFSCDDYDNTEKDYDDTEKD